MRPSPLDLLAAPELAILDVLDAVLEATAAALLAAHLDPLDPNSEPETPRRPGQPEPAAVTVARAILALERPLRAQLAAYREALEADHADTRRRQIDY